MKHSRKLCRRLELEFELGRCHDAELPEADDSYYCHVMLPIERSWSWVRGRLAREKTGRDLVLLAEVLLLALALGGLGADLLVVLLEGSKILASLGELALLHALADVPVHEGTLGVHEVELVVDARESLGDGRGVGN